MTDYGSIGGYGVALTAGGLLLAIGQMAWTKFFSAPSQAETTLYSGLSEQLRTTIERVDNLQRQLDDERKLRHMAENRIAQLELELAKHGIEVPPEGET